MHTRDSLEMDGFDKLQDYHYKMKQKATLYKFYVNI